MKQKIHAGEKVLGMFLSEIGAPNLVRVMQASGVDFVIVDCEHGYFDFSQVAAIAAVGSGIGFPVIVRVPHISRECIQKYLDAGVDGLLVPMLETEDQARMLVRLGKYAPEGARGISTMRPHSNYNPGDLVSYTEKANKRTMFFAQIESRAGVQNAEAIASVPGLDGIFIGPNDLACDMGMTGQFNTPEMDEAIGHVVKAAKAHHIPCGIIASSAPFLRKWEERGMNMFSCDSELGLLKKGIQAMVKSVNS